MADDSQEVITIYARLNALSSCKQLDTAQKQSATCEAGDLESALILPVFTWIQ